MVESATENLNTPGLTRLDKCDLMYKYTDQPCPPPTPYHGRFFRSSEINSEYENSDKMP